MATKIDLKVVFFVIIALIGLYFFVFKPPFSQKTPVTPSFCGGVANIKCPSGYRCQLEGDYPDAGGTCLKKP